jgi:hypothetical protein
LDKIIRLLNEIENRYQDQLELSKAYYRRLKPGEKNEILWIFFGVHTANAVRIAKRLSISRVEFVAS